MVLAAGVDASHLGPDPGWVVILLAAGELHSATYLPTLDDVASIVADADAVALNLPLGHDDPSGAIRGGRRLADLEARAWLGPRGGSVFPAPPLDLYAQPDHASACAQARTRGLPLPSAASWGYRERIGSAQGAAERNPRIFEAHPEVSFQELLRASGGGAHLTHPKRSWKGLHERLILLHGARLRPTRSLGGLGHASPEDVLDATVLAWSALRKAHGDAIPLPDVPPRDPSTNRVVAIWR